MTETDELAPDTIDLINQLCTRVGMLMEDGAPLASKVGIRAGVEVYPIATAGQRDVHGFADRCGERISKRLISAHFGWSSHF